jgi:hypothetical protein
MREWIGDEVEGDWFCDESEARCCRSDESDEHWRRASVYSEFIPPRFLLAIERPEENRLSLSSLSLVWLRLGAQDRQSRIEKCAL